MTRTLLSICAAALSLCLLSSGASASHDSDTKPYTQLAGDQYVLLCDSDNLGGACFSLDDEPVATSLDVRIDDITGLPVGGYYQIEDASDPPTALSVGSFCGSVSGVPVPADAVRLIVFVDGPVFGPQDCLLAGTRSPGIGIAGTITVTYGYTAPVE